jgi:ABC-type branched-subunit amino acid transport system substrate-binding protein
MNRRKAITLACAAAAGLSRPTLGLATGKPSSDGVVRLGQSTALTGANGAVGRQFRDAALGWFNLANSQGGAGGYRIELITLDDGGVVERATTNAKLLTSTHGAAGFFGFAGPGANREGMQGAMEEGVPFIAPVSGMDVLRQRDNTNVYLLRAGHRDEIRQIIRHASSTGITRVALLFEYESAGWEIRDSFVQAADAAKLASSVSASVSRGSTDVGPAVAALVAANPQAIILAANPSASAAFVRLSCGLRARLVSAAVSTPCPPWADRCCSISWVSSQSEYPWPRSCRFRGAAPQRSHANSWAFAPPVRSSPTSPAWKATLPPAG